MKREMRRIKQLLPEEKTAGLHKEHRPYSRSVYCPKGFY